MTNISLQLSLVLGLVFVTTTRAYDKYEDALQKYKKWQERFEKYGSVRTQRNTEFDNVIRREDVTGGNIFSPHRPAVSGGRILQFDRQQFSADPIFSGLSSGPNFARGTRNSGLSNNIQLGQGYSDYVNSLGVPLYKIKKRNPLGYYGRRRRSIADADNQRFIRSADQGWEILDPNTGRPLETVGPESARNTELFADPIFSSLDTPDLLRDSRKSVNNQAGSDEGYVTAEGTPLYKIRKQTPHGYGRRKRSAQGAWEILDPNTGRPIKLAVPDFYSPSVVRSARQGVQQIQNTSRNPGYKYYKRYPYSG